MEADAPACAEHEASAAARDGTASAGSSDPEGGRAQTRWGRCFYTRLPRAVHAPGAEGAALTALNLDKTAALEQALAALGDPGGKQLLGELQFAYIAFLYGQSLEGARWTGMWGGGRRRDWGRGVGGSGWEALVEALHWVVC